jgi:hypothetical protein
MPGWRQGRVSSRHEEHQTGPGTMPARQTQV